MTHCWKSNDFGDNFQALIGHLLCLSFFILDDDTEAKRLANKVRVLCLITTWPENLDSRAIHVKETWGKRCSILLFFSSVKNDSFPTIGLNVTEGRRHLNGKVMLAFRYIYEHYLDKADWFMKADDDTYVILENLRYFLSGENPDDPIYFGHHLKPRQTDEGFFSGGAGYVISKEALRRLGEKGFNKSVCQQEGRKEDVYFARCMGKLNVKMGNSTDVLGRSRFHCLSPYFHISGRYSMWYRIYDIHGAKKVITVRLPCGIHTGKCIRRFGGIYAYCRYFIDRKW